jgi:hypothetical protein
LTAADKEGLSAKFGHWTALYAAYLFLAGWAYLRYYFAVFGVDAGWLDLGVNDTVARGFSVLFGTGWCLSVVYVSIFLLSLVLEVFCVNHSRKLNALVACVSVLLFPVTFWVAEYAGVGQANKDRGAKTSLPTITFAAGKCSYRGKVVYVKAEALYIFDLTYLEEPGKCVVCPFDLTGASPEVPQLWFVRSGDLKDVRVIHYQKEAKPW